MADSLANLAIDTATSSQVIHPSARCGHADLHAHSATTSAPGWPHPSDVAPLIPLDDPTNGFRDNCATSMVLLFVTSFLTVAGVMSQVRAAAAIPLALYTNIDMVLVGIASSVPFMGLATLVAIYWRYPIFWVLFAPPWLLCVAFGNAVVLWRHLHVVGRSRLAYTPSLVVQVVQIIIYPAYSAAFEAAGLRGQIALILVFPLLKFGLKKGIFALRRHMNRELSAEISTSSVEICSSVYQSIVMQSTPSPLATALLIGIDVLHGLYAVRKFMLQDSAFSRTGVVAILARLVGEASEPVIQNRMSSVDLAPARP